MSDQSNTQPENETTPDAPDQQVNVNVDNGGDGAAPEQAPAGGDGESTDKED